MQDFEIVASIIIPLVSCAVSAVATVGGSRIIPGGRMGKTLRMLDLYERLPLGTALKPSEMLILAELRKEIYSNVLSSLGYKLVFSEDGEFAGFKKKYGTLTIVLMSCVVSVVMDIALVTMLWTEFREDASSAFPPASLLAESCLFSCVAIVAMVGAMRVLGKGPKVGWNYFYVREKTYRAKQRDFIDAAKEFDSFDKDMAEFCVERNFGRVHRNV